MTVAPSHLGRLRIGNEPSNAFMTELGLGSFVDVPVVGTPTLVTPREMVAPGVWQQRGGAQEKKVFLPKLGTRLTTKVNLASRDTPAGDGVAATRTWLVRFFEVLFGGPQFQGTGNTVSGAGSTVSAIDLTSAANFRPGGAFAIARSNGILEAREIKSIASNTITPKIDLSEAPVDTSVVYAAYSLFPDTLMRPNTWLQAIYEGWGQDHKLLLRGGQLESMTLSISPGTLIQAEFVWKFATWDFADGVATTMDLTTSPLGLASYADQSGHIAAESFFRAHVLNTSTLAGTQLEPSAIEWNFKMHWSDLRTVSEQTIYGYQRTVDENDRADLSGSFVVPLEDRAFYDYQDAAEDLAISFQAGSDPTKRCLLLTASTVQIDNVEPTDVDNVVGHKVSWTARLDEESDKTGLAGDDLEMAYAPGRVHVF